jgi:hypothetical protein
MLCGPVGEELDVSLLRHTGYRQALEGAGLRVDPALTQSMEAFTMREGAQRVREMVESGFGFDGVFCVTDTLAMGVLRGLADVGVRVPEQVKVVGFDNVESSEFLVPRCPPSIRITAPWPNGRSRCLPGGSAGPSSRRTRRSSSAASPWWYGSRRAADPAAARPAPSY